MFTAAGDWGSERSGPARSHKPETLLPTSTIAMTLVCTRYADYFFCGIRSFATTKVPIKQQASVPRARMDQIRPAGEATGVSIGVVSPHSPSPSSSKLPVYLPAFTGAMSMRIRFWLTFLSPNGLCGADVLVHERHQVPMPKGAVLLKRF